MTKLRATTALAADICHIDRQRFNEAVASGFYPCAPETVAGRPRFFDVSDLLALRIYGHHLREGVTPRHAGHAACGVRAFLREHPEAERVLQVVADFGAHLGPVSWLPPEKFDVEATWISGREIVSVREWRLAPMRAAIIARLEDEDASRVLGPSDEEA